MRIDADSAQCIAAGHCVRLLPQNFEQNHDIGTVVVINAELDSTDAALTARIREVRDSCPVGAIKIVVPDGKEQS